MCKKCGYESEEWQQSDGDENEDEKRNDKIIIKWFLVIVLVIVLAIISVCVYRYVRINNDYIDKHYVNDSFGITLELPNKSWKAQESEDYLITLTPKNTEEDGSAYIEVFKTDEDAFFLACNEDEFEQVNVDSHTAYKVVDGNSEDFCINYYIQKSDKESICISFVGGDGKKLDIGEVEKMIREIKIA